MEVPPNKKTFNTFFFFLTFNTTKSVVFPLDSYTLCCCCCCEGTRWRQRREIRKLERSCSVTWYRPVRCITRHAMWVFWYVWSEEKQRQRCWLGEWFVVCFMCADGEVSVVEALLAELPSQFLTYMRNRNITPSSITASASWCHSQQLCTYIQLQTLSFWLSILLLLLSGIFAFPVCYVKFHFTLWFVSFFLFYLKKYDFYLILFAKLQIDLVGYLCSIIVQRSTYQFTENILSCWLNFLF